MGDGNQDSFVRNERFLNTRDQCLRILAGPSKSTEGHEISGVLQVRLRKLIVSMADPRSNLLSSSLLMVTCLMQYWSMSSTSPSPRKTFWYKHCIREVRNPQPRRHTASCPQNGSYDTMNGGVCTAPTTPRTALPGPWNRGAVNGHIQGIHDINPPRGEDEAAVDGWAQVGPRGTDHASLSRLEMIPFSIFIHTRAARKQKPPTHAHIA